MKKLIRKQLDKQLNGFRSAKKLLTVRQCNLCKNTFQLKSPFQRFCSECKKNNDVYRMAEWLPQGPLMALSFRGAMD